MTKRKRLTTRQRLAIFEASGGRCASCSRKLGPADKWDIDHIIPLALGGADEPENMQVLCDWCHGKKTAQEDAPRIAKARRQAARHLGIRKRNSRPIPGSKRTRWKKRLDGTVVPREQ